jgi:hypothetical protein
MFEAHVRRQAAERVHELKNAMVSGAWANMNYDEGNVRKDLLAKIDQFVDEAIRTIYGEEVEVDMTTPFLAAMKVPEIDHRMSNE